jgi:ATP-dependent exoDNAse (exonuclease V) alpha subunit
MLTKNIWQGKGLYNGAFGTVRAIKFADGQNASTLPLYVLVEFDDYTGPSVSPGHDRLVPIAPLKIAFDYKAGVTGSQEQIPLALGWALTIHKAQGLTLLWIILNLGDSEMQLGISFVGCSRVKSYRGLAFEKSFAWQRMEKVNQKPELEMIRREILRLESIPIQRNGEEG